MLRLYLIVLLFFSLETQARQPLGTPDKEEIEYPEDEPPSTAEVELGKMLFFDPRLSVNQKQSCATCHNPNLGFSDGMAKGVGTMGEQLTRNAPHLYNLAWNTTLFWDGRAASLEEQALGPIEASAEMNMPLPLLEKRLNEIEGYRQLFQKVYNQKTITAEYIAKAIASFERTIISDNSPFDRYLAGDTNAMTPSARRGLKIFKTKARCTECHDGTNFTDESFHNLGLSDSDIGRQKIDPTSGLIGAFKTPGLRNITLSAPYMHDGSLGTLEDVIRFYNKGGNSNKHKDKLMQPLHLNEQEIADLIAFMGALTDPVLIAQPALPKN